MILARETASRRRQLAHRRRFLEAFETKNCYQAELRNTTLAMIGFMENYWCGPERAADFRRWWRIVASNTGALVARTLEGPGSRRRLKWLLDRNQIRPTEL